MSPFAQLESDTTLQTAHPAIMPDLDEFDLSPGQSRNEIERNGRTLC
jgi:hypothetical protein